MKKILILIIIALLLITYCNIIINNHAIEVARKLKLELHEKERRIAELEQSQPDPDNIFDYILAQNPNLSTRELADFVSYTYQLAEEAKVDPYIIFAICEIESHFRMDVIGPCKERGPMQVTEGLWNSCYKKYGFNQGDINNPFCTMKVATFHFKHLLGKHKNDLTAAIGEYNGGGNWAKTTQAPRHVKKFQVASRGTMKYREGDEQ